MYLSFSAKETPNSINSAIFANEPSHLWCQKNLKVWTKDFRKKCVISSYLTFQITMLYCLDASIKNSLSNNITIQSINRPYAMPNCSIFKHVSVFLFVFIKSFSLLFEVYNSKTEWSNVYDLMIWYHSWYFSIQDGTGRFS